MATQTVPDFAFLHKKPKEQLLKKNQDVTERTLEHKVKREALSCTRDPREGLRKAATVGRPRGMEWGGRREEGSGWGTHVYLWRIHFDIWQI